MNLDSVDDTVQSSLRLDKSRDSSLQPMNFNDTSVSISYRAPPKTAQVRDLGQCSISYLSSKEISHVPSKEIKFDES